MRSPSLVLPVFVLFFAAALVAQDASTGALRGTVTDASGARVAGAEVRLISAQTGVERTTATTQEGTFFFEMLLPGEYGVQVSAPAMAALRRYGIQVEVGGAVELALGLEVAGSRETVTVSGAAPVAETLPAAVSSVLDERAISELPLNGRRFSDLALLTPGVTQDPRSLTSATNGDLAFGGIRGFQTSFLVDGVDNNNAFFSQERGRYRAPYQFSNEVVQEFRVSSNTYGPELGRSGGAVINVVTRSGGNQWHGSLFDYYRDGRLGAGYPDISIKPPNRQDQFGFTLGGPIKRNRVFFFAGFDQHIFHIPTVVQFSNGATAVVPQPTDYEATDQALVFAAAAQLSQLGGQFRTALVGNAGFGKLDFVLSPHNHLSARLSTSRYWGENNVFFDPASPITNFGINNNGEEAGQHGKRGGDADQRAAAAPHQPPAAAVLPRPAGFLRQFQRPADQDLQPHRRLRPLQHPAPHHPRAPPAARRNPEPGRPAPPVEVRWRRAPDVDLQLLPFAVRRRVLLRHHQGEPVHL